MELGRKWTEHKKVAARRGGEGGADKNKVSKAARARQTLSGRQINGSKSPPLAESAQELDLSPVDS